MLCFIRKSFLALLFMLFCNIAKAENIYICISFSMPENLIKEYIQESTKYSNSVLVLRGLVDNSYTKTAKKLNAVNNNNGVKAVIDPNVFKKYNVKQVPTIVLEKSENNFDKISGAVSIKYAIETFNNEK